MKNEEESRKFIKILKEVQSTVITYEEAVGKLMNKHGLSKEDAEELTKEIQRIGSTLNISEE